MLPKKRLELTYTSLAREYGSTQVYIVQMLEDKYGEIPELTHDVEQMIRCHFKKRKPVKKKQAKEIYEAAYKEMQDKGYFTNEDLANYFGKINYEQIKCNFDSNGFYIYEGYKQYLKEGWPKNTKDVKAWGKLPIVMPCRDKDGNWIADKEII